MSFIFKGHESKSILAVGFILEQPLYDVTLLYSDSALGILKRLQYNNIARFLNSSFLVWLNVAWTKVGGIAFYIVGMIYFGRFRWIVRGFSRVIGQIFFITLRRNFISMSIFLESIWVWIGLAIIAGVVGFIMFQNDQRVRTFLITVICVAVLLVTGILLYNFVDTDRKSVSRTLSKIVSTIEKDDLESLLKFIDENADKPRGLARSNMSLIVVPKASFSDLDVKVNYLTNPPIASVSFIAMINWKPKSGWLQNEFPT
ncbi:MAG: hypothetical protein LBJ00_06860, partial [Planctomycetaceae bacterium]|nr:hypothetical protein [Planctomycetaceae bacterium]